MGVVAVTETLPEPAGLEQETDVLLSTETFVAAFAANCTAEHPVRFVPVRVQTVPPEVAPEVGEMLESVGVEPYVYVTPLLVP